MAHLSHAVRRFLALPDDERRLGPYRCRRLLGKGGFAPVFLADQEHDGKTLRQVAVKVFRMGDDELGAHVLDEATTLSQFRHPNVVGFINLYPDREQGLLGLVMEYLEGAPLDREAGDLDAEDPARVSLAVEVGLAVSAALETAHRQRIVHRDVKPANILLCDGVVKLIDFGIAVAGERSPARAEPRVVVLGDVPIDAGSKASFVQQLAGSSSSVEASSGTHGYIDPVCVRSTSPATAESDLYSLGATLFECLTRLLPASAATRARAGAGLDGAVLRGDARAISVGELATSLPRRLVRLVDALLSPVREERPRSAAAVHEELALVRRDLPAYLRARALSAFLASASPPRVGPFELLERLGEGVSAPVYRARDTRADADPPEVAVKLFALATSATAPVDETLRLRLELEARILRQLDHPNIARFHGLHATDDGRVVGLATEYVRGRSLASMIEGLDPERDPEDTKQQLSLRLIVDIGRAIARALDAVHQQGIVHGDVKPANVVVADRVAKLIDFGSATIVHTGGRSIASPAPLGAREGATVPQSPMDEASRATRSRELRGTPGYEDPASVASGAPPTASSDLYALGATLFYCLAGHPPAARDGVLRDAVLDGRERPPHVGVIATGAPTSLASIVDELLQPDRGDRPASGEFVARKLDLVWRELARQRERLLPIEDVGPFRGLGRYGLRDRDCFFGRHGELATALGLLRSSPVLLVAGPPRSGRTSFCLAGVLAALEAGDLDGVPTPLRPVVVGSRLDPWLSLTNALEPFFPEAAECGPEELHAALLRHVQRTGTGLAIFLDDVERLFADEDAAPGTATDERPTLPMPLVGHAPPRGRPVERAVPLGGGAFAARQFLSDAASRLTPGLRVVCTVSAHELQRLLMMPLLSRGVAVSWMSVGPMQPPVWSEVLEGAANRYHYAWEDDALVPEIIAEIERTAMPMALTQRALAELWARRQIEGARLTRRAWSEIGGLVGAIDHYADSALDRVEEGLSCAGRRVALEVLVAVTEPDGRPTSREEHDVREQVGASALLPSVVDALLRAGLIVRERTALSLAYPGLARHWRVLRATLDERRQVRTTFASLERHAAAWAQAPANVPPWTRGVLDVLAQRDRGVVRLSPRALEFLALSERRHWRRQYAVRSIVAASLFAAVWLGLWAQTATTQARARAVSDAAEVEELRGKLRRALEESTCGATPTPR